MKGKVVEEDEQEIEEGEDWFNHQKLSSLRFLFFKLLNRETKF